MDKLQSVLDKFPSYYNTDNTSALYKLISAIVDEVNSIVLNIDRVDDMIGIDGTQTIDLQPRWGDLLNINKVSTETYEQYRSRLKNSVVSMSGGTARAIQYAIAVGLGINNDEELINSTIKVYDAWKYDQQYDYGHIVITIDLQGRLYNSTTESLVNQLATESKAAGIIMHYIPNNYAIIYYHEMVDITYESLSGILYSTLGKEI